MTSLTVLFDSNFLFQLFLRLLASVLGFKAESQHLLSTATMQQYGVDTWLKNEQNTLNPEDRFLALQNENTMESLDQFWDTRGGLETHEQTKPEANERAGTGNGHEKLVDLDKHRSSLNRNRNLRMCYLKRQWELISDVLDRCFAVFFFMVNILAIVVLFPKPSAEYLTAKNT